jgi:hypothetical protein
VPALEGHGSTAAERLVVLVWREDHRRPVEDVRSGVTGVARHPAPLPPVDHQPQHESDRTRMV